MSLQTLERQLNSITQKLEAIHSDIKGKGAGFNKGSDAAGGELQIGRRRGNNKFAESPGGSEDAGVLAPSPPPGRNSSPERTRPVRATSSSVLITEPESGSASPSGSMRGTNPCSPNVVFEGEVGRGGRSHDSSINSNSGGSQISPQTSSLAKPDKKKSAADRQAKKNFFGPMEFNGPWNQVPKASGVTCVWLGCAALAIEFVSGKTTTMEEIMNTNHMALHYVSFPSVTLAELYDTVEEYLIASNLRHHDGVKCEVATFDSITVDDVGDEIGMGERLPVMTLAAFRKELARADTSSILIFNYDPYVVQEAEIIRRQSEEEDEDDATVPSTPKTKEPVQWAQKNQGQFALLLEFNPALHTVTIATPNLGPDGTFKLEMHTASVQTMYAACCIKDGYTCKSRGFVRVFKDKLGETQVPSIFPLSLLDGRDAGGLISVALDVAIAPHILGLSMLHHVVQSTLLSEKARRRQSTKSVSDVQLRGIPVTKLCSVLGLPVSTIVGASNKESVSCAFAWYQIFLTKVGIQNDVAVGAVTVTRKGGAADGAVNLSDEQFLTDVSTAVSTKSVMLIGFDINVALNVVVETRSEPCHFAIVVGIDEAHGIVRLADVNVKKYRKLWHVPITRLYNAVVGYGYIIAAKSKDVIEKFNCQRMVDTIASLGKYKLPADPGFRRFEYPSKNYTVTVLADAMDRLGFKDVTVESFVYHSGFHVSFLLSEHIPLAGAKRIASFYSHSWLSDEVSVAATFYDNRSVQTLDYFVASVSEAVARSDAYLLVNFQPATIQKDKAVWNGGQGGPLAIVLRYDETTRQVSLCDANASQYYRTWSCPIELLYEAVAQTDRISGRARGTLLLEKKPQQTYDDAKGYDMRRAMVHHPFKPTISTTASVMALAASEMTQKSFSQEQFIYNALEFKLTNFTMRGANVAAVVADANHTFTTLGIRLVAAVMECASLGDFKAALEGVEGMLSITIVLYNTEQIHKAAGLGYGAAMVNNRGEDGVVKLVDGNPTVFGDFWESPVHELFSSLLGVIVVKGIADQEDELES